MEDFVWPNRHSGRTLSCSGSSSGGGGGSGSSSSSNSSGGSSSGGGGAGGSCSSSSSSTVVVVVVVVVIIVPSSGGVSSAVVVVIVIKGIAFHQQVSLFVILSLLRVHVPLILIGTEFHFRPVWLPSPARWFWFIQCIWCTTCSPGAEYI